MPADGPRARGDAEAKTEAKVGEREDPGGCSGHPGRMSLGVGEAVQGRALAPDYWQPEVPASGPVTTGVAVGSDSARMPTSTNWRVAAPQASLRWLKVMKASW